MLKLIKEWLLPITIVAFMGPNITPLQDILSTSVRWIFSILLVVYLLVIKDKKKVPRVLLMVTCLYTLWCLVTAIWSEQFNLSIIKAISATVVLFSCLYAGQTWAVRAGEARALNYLGAFSLITLAVTVVGYFFSPNAFSVYGMFQGYTYNPNVFGAFAAVSSAFFIWKAYLNRSKTKWFRLWVAIYSLTFIAVIMSQSRGALLIMLCILLGFLFTRSAGRLVTTFFSVAFLALTVCSFFIFPDTSDKVINRTIYKDSSTVFYTHEKTWEDSLDKAREGGWFGGGYGISIGAEDWEGGFTANTYGREKGSSQLAVLEETGVVGFILYISVILVILKKLHAGYRAALSGNAKVAMALVYSTVVGLIVQSMFEGWWVALGSIDAVLFWTTTGVGIGLSSLSMRQSISALRKF